MDCTHHDPCEKCCEPLDYLPTFCLVKGVPRSLCPKNRVAGGLADIAVIQATLDTSEPKLVCSRYPRERPDWTSYFMGIVEAVKLRSPDPRTQVGAVLTTQDNRIISTGYNAFAAGVPESAVDWSDRPSVYARIIHAEANALLAARGAIPANPQLYCSFSPCRECVKLMAAAGVARVVFKTAYRDFDEVKHRARELGIKMEVWNGEAAIPV